MEESEGAEEWPADTPKGDQPHGDRRDGITGEYPAKDRQKFKSKGSIAFWLSCASPTLTGCASGAARSRPVVEYIGGSGMKRLSEVHQRQFAAEVLSKNPASLLSYNARTRCSSRVSANSVRRIEHRQIGPAVNCR